MSKENEDFYGQLNDLINKDIAYGYLGGVGVAELWMQESVLQNPVMKVSARRLSV